jgi:hypothetical protein
MQGLLASFVHFHKSLHTDIISYYAKHSISISSITFMIIEHGFQVGASAYAEMNCHT